MPARDSHIPTYRERAILQPLVGRDWLPAGKLSSAATPSTISRMCKKGWLERKRDATLGWTYRVTETGEAALKLLIPSKPRSPIEERKATPEPSAAEVIAKP
jgi:hypothetical protein